jgi:hypothetical protein
MKKKSAIHQILILQTKSITIVISSVVMIITRMTQISARIDHEDNTWLEMMLLH